MILGDQVTALLAPTIIAVGKQSIEDRVGEETCSNNAPSHLPSRCLGEIDTSRPG